MILSPVNRVVVADSVCKMNPSVLHNGFRLTWLGFVTVFICFSNKASSSPQGQTGSTVIYLTTDNLATSLCSCSLCLWFCLSVFIYELNDCLLVTVYEWDTHIKQCVCADFWCIIICTLCLAQQRKRPLPRLNRQVWEMGCRPLGGRGGLKKRAKKEEGGV